MNRSALLEDIMADLDGWGLSGIICVFFKGCSEYCNDLMFKIEIQGLKDP